MWGQVSTQAAIDPNMTDSRYTFNYGDADAVNPPQNPVNVYAFYDNFQDGNADGWTVADGTWVMGSEGPNSFYRYTGGGTGWAITQATLPASNIDYLAKIRGTASPITNWIGLAFRIQDPANFLTFYQSRDVNQFKLARIIGDNHQIYYLSPGYTMSADVWHWLRLQAVGSTVRARIWADGSAEPSTWTIDTTETTFQSSTNIGLTLYNHTTNADWDDIQVRRLVAVEPTVTLSPWGDNTYDYKRPLTVTNTSASAALPVDYSTSFTLDTASLIANNQMLSTCADLRVVYQPDLSASPLELDRVVENCNTAQTVVWFALQRAVAASGQDLAYTLYYGKPAPGTPPADGMNVFLFFEDWEQGTDHWTNAGGLDPTNKGTMGSTVISNYVAISPTQSQLFNSYGSGGDAFSGYIPVSPSIGYAISVWGASQYTNVCAPVGFDPYTSEKVKGTESWLWLGDWRLGPQWAWKTATFTTSETTAYIKIKSEVWHDCSTPGSPPAFMDNLALRYAISSEPALALGDEETILPVPTIAKISDNGPRILIGSNFHVTADLATTQGTITAATLRILSPQVVNVPMTLCSGNTTSGTWQADFTPTQGGLYTYQIYAAAGPLIRLSAHRTFTAYETTPPVITPVSIIDPIFVNNPQTLTVQVTDNDALSNVNVTIGGTSHPMTANGSQYSYSWLVTTPGTIPYTVTATDISGNVATLNGTFESLSDTTLPQIALVSIAADPILVKNTQTLIVQVTDNGVLSSVNVTAGGGTYPMTGLGNHQYSFSWQVISTGTIPYTVTAADTSNNVATLNGSFVSQPREVDVCTWWGCRRGAASWSIDDGYSSCREVLETAGIRGTYFYSGGSTLDWFSEYSAAGHEIASHTVGHPCNTPACSPTCTPESLAALPVDDAVVTAYRRDQIEPNIAVIEAGTGKPVLSLAWPCGCTDPSRWTAAQSYVLGARGYYDYIAQLAWLEDVNLQTPVNLFNLNTAHSYRQDFIDQAYAEGKWSTTTSHGACDGIDYIGLQNANGHLWVAPIGEVLQYIKVRDASQLTNYSRVGRTISFTAHHTLSTFTPTSISTIPYTFLPITFDNPVTLQVHILASDTVIGVTVDGSSVSYVIQTIDGERYVIFDAALNASRNVVVNLAAPAPTVSDVVDIDPVELGASAQVDATVIPVSTTTLYSVTLHVTSPIVQDFSMSNVSGDLYRASFVPTQLGSYTYQVIASNTEGGTTQTTPAVFTVVDRTSPIYRAQSQSHNSIPVGDPNVLSVEGWDQGALSRAVLSTDESGSWQNFDWTLGDWWNHAWSYRRAVVVSEPSGLARSAETVDLLFNEASLTSCNELRVTNQAGTELAVQVYGSAPACHLLFQATVAANGAQTYYVYYGNPTAPTPSYTTDLTAVTNGSLRTIHNSFFDLDLSGTSGIITRVQLPQGSNANLPLSTSGESYWGWHQVCSTIDGNITGKNNLCQGGAADASGLNLTETLSGPLVREYTLTSVKAANTYTIKYRFFANSPYYQYTLARTGTAAVLNNFWYVNGNFPRLGAGSGGTPAATYNTYQYNTDYLRIASLATIDYGSIDGTNNDGTQLGATDYQFPLAAGLNLFVTTGADQTAAEDVLARLNAPLTLTPGTVETAPVGQYGSPVVLTPGMGWVAVSFSWQNPAIQDRVVHWRVTFYDVSGNAVTTPDMAFTVGSPVETATLGFKPGWNLITLPLQPVSALNAETMLVAVNGQGGSCTVIGRWIDSGWGMHPLGIPYEEFAITLGEGYFVLCSQASTWDLAGHPLTSGVTVSVYPGYNLVGFPYPGIGQTAQSILAGINLQGAACTEMNQWINSAWEPYITGIPYNDFAIQPNEGYFVRCTTSGSYTP